MRSSSSTMLSSSVSVIFPVAFRISSCCSGVSFSWTEGRFPAMHLVVEPVNKAAAPFVRRYEHDTSV